MFTFNSSRSQIALGPVLLLCELHIGWDFIKCLNCGRANVLVSVALIPQLFCSKVASLYTNCHHDASFSVGLCLLNCARVLNLEPRKGRRAEAALRRAGLPPHLPGTSNCCSRNRGTTGKSPRSSSSHACLGKIAYYHVENGILISWKTMLSTSPTSGSSAGPYGPIFGFSDESQKSTCRMPKAE